MSEKTTIFRLSKLPDPELVQASQLGDLPGTDVYYSGRTVVRLIQEAREEERSRQNDEIMRVRESLNLQELKDLADAVHPWSNCNQAWLDHSEDESAAVVGHIDEDGNTYPVATIDCDQYACGEDSIKLARFYAAVTPATVSRLIALIDSGFGVENNDR